MSIDRYEQRSQKLEQYVSKCSDTNNSDAAATIASLARHIGVLVAIATHDDIWPLVDHYIDQMTTNYPNPQTALREALEQQEQKQ